MSERIHDSELLRSFVHDGSQSAFAALAKRYAGLAFHLGMRFSGSAELAEEAAQNAFLILAEKSAEIDASQGLAAWLHRAVYFEASKLRDRERRYRAQVERFAREVEIGAGDEWKAVTAVLDPALNELGEDDRQVILLRFFHGYSYKDLAELDGSEAATWRKRCSRAVERLREKLDARGAAIPTAMLVGGLTGWLQQPAPASVVGSLSGTTGEGVAPTGATAIAGLRSFPHLRTLLLAAALALPAVLIWKGLQSGGGTDATPPGTEMRARLTALTKKSQSADRPDIDRVKQFNAEEKRAWLQALRDHLNEPGPPHGTLYMERIGGLGGGGRDGGYLLGRSALHEYLDRVGGDPSGLLEVLKEALDSERATVAYRALGLWGWVRDYAGEDGAITLIDFAARTPVRSNALYAMNILGQYNAHYPADLAQRFVAMLESGSDNARIALSYCGPGFVNGDALGEEFLDRLRPLLDHSDPSTRFAAARMLAEIPRERGRAVLAALLDIPDYLEEYHFDRTLSQLLMMPAGSADGLATILADALTQIQDRLPSEPGTYAALMKFGLAGEEESIIDRWQEEAQALGARKGDGSLTVTDLLVAMENPFARSFAIKEITRIGPNAVEHRGELLTMLMEDTQNRDLAFAVYSTDINQPHPYPWIDMRGMYEVLKPVDEALAASDDPAWTQFRRDLDVWMIGEPHTDVIAARKLADDLGDVSAELRELFVEGLREGEGTERLAELAFGAGGE